MYRVVYIDTVGGESVLNTAGQPQPTEDEAIEEARMLCRQGAIDINDQRVYLIQGNLQELCIDDLE